jgi:O-antigen ligase
MYKKLFANVLEEQGVLKFLRYIKLFLTWLIFWQDSYVGGSVFQVEEYYRNNALSTNELCIIAVLLIVIIERCIQKDFSVKRSYFHVPLLALFGALFISWVHGMVIRQQFTIVFEAHEAIQLPIAFWVFLNAYRDPKDAQLLLTLLLSACVMKAIESCYIYRYSHDTMRKAWGTVQMWRDAYLLAIGPVIAVLLIHMKSTSLRLVRKWMIIALPLLIFGLIISVRRTAFLAVFIACVSMFFTLGKRYRGKHALLFASLVIGAFVLILVTDPLNILSRLAGIIAPGEEGSAFIRVIEFPNVLKNIAANPILGTAVGTEWKQYYRMPFTAIYTTLGTHMSYLYWPLRAGIFGTFAYAWLLTRIWKSIGVQFLTMDREKDFFIGHALMQMMIVYQVSAFFGIVYNDPLNRIMAMFLVLLQLKMTEASGLTHLSDVHLFQSLRKRRVIAKALIPPARSFA